MSDLVDQYKVLLLLNKYKNHITSKLASIKYDPKIKLTPTQYDLKIF